MGIPSNANDRTNRFFETWWSSTFQRRCNDICICPGNTLPRGHIVLHLLLSNWHREWCNPELNINKFFRDFKCWIQVFQLHPDDQLSTSKSVLVRVGTKIVKYFKKVQVLLVWACNNSIYKIILCLFFVL